MINRMHFLFPLFLIPITKAFVIVKIHRNSFYDPQSPCAFIGNSSFSNDASIQSCIWECVHEPNCQTAVYYKNEKICSTFNEYCEIGHIKPLENDQASTICYRKNHNPTNACPLSTTVNQKDNEETTTLEMMMTTDVPNLIILTDTNESIFGIWNTTAGGNSTPATSGSGVGNYIFNQFPNCAFDRDPSTKYLNFGALFNSIDSGINTGFYITPNRGPSLLIAMQFCTADDCETRDPWTMTIEGSNQTSSALTLGSSWTLIYNGPTGIDHSNSTQRQSNGTKIWFTNNTVWYSSYRLLITSKSGVSDGVQYSEVEFFIH